MDGERPSTPVASRRRLLQSNPGPVGDAAGRRPDQANQRAEQALVAETL
ncbi:hypothetical protein [Haloarchaeobius sp. DT45]